MKAQSSKTEKKIAVHTRERAKNLASFNRLEKELDRLKGKLEAHDNAIEALRNPEPKVGDKIRFNKWGHSHQGVIEEIIAGTNSYGYDYRVSVDSIPLRRDFIDELDGERVSFDRTHGYCIKEVS